MKGVRSDSGNQNNHTKTVNCSWFGCQKILKITVLNIFLKKGV